MSKMEKQILDSKFNTLKLQAKLEKLKEKTGLIVQTLLFPKNRFTIESAKQWAVKNGYDSKTVKITDNNIRLRQKNPDFKDFKTVNFGSGIKAVVAGDLKSKFVGRIYLQNFSKFQEIKSDLDMVIPMMGKIEFLCEGQNRDGTLRREDLEASVNDWDGIPIIDWHDMDDKDHPTKHKIRDRVGYLKNPSLLFRDGKFWMSADVRILSRDMAYRLYIQEKIENKPLQISPEYGWNAYYMNGEKFQTNLKPHLVSIVDEGHIEGNKLTVVA